MSKTLGKSLLYSLGGALAGLTYHYGLAPCRECLLPTDFWGPVGIGATVGLLISRTGP